MQIDLLYQASRLTCSVALKMKAVPMNIKPKAATTSGQSKSLFCSLMGVVVHSVPGQRRGWRAAGLLPL